MADALSFDRAFQGEIPLPLARLYTRAHNSKGERERHDHAFHLLEAALKLATSVLVARYRARGEHSEKVDDALSHLALPSLGQWRDMFRCMLEFLGAPPRADPWASRVLERLGARGEDEALGGILAALARAVQYGGRLSARPTLLEVLDLLPAYRNAMSDAHGSIKADRALYREATPDLLRLARLLLDGGAILGGGRLVYAEDVNVGREGERRVVWIDLTGPTALRRNALEGEVLREAILPDRLYLELTPAEHLPLHPLLCYRSVEILDQVFFLNRIRRGKSGIQFLCYDTGDFHLPGRDELGDHLVRELEDLLSWILSRRVDSKEREGMALEFRSSGAEAVEFHEEDEAPEPDGTRLGDFEILGELGRGGMAVVYKARQRSLGRTVALKVLPPLLEEDTVSLARFRQEVTALSRCDHPNVVKILTASDVDRSCYYAMEFIDGADLFQIRRTLDGYRSAGVGALKEAHFDRAASSTGLDRGSPGRAVLPAVDTFDPVDLSGLTQGRDISFRLAAVMRDAAEGVQHIHDHGIIHRDLKPQNIMVTREDHRPVVMDLGLAKLADVSQSLTIDKGSILGTLRYMAPEQLQRNLLEVDARADVYSLGAVLYELACLRPMLDGDTKERLTAQILFGEPPPPQKVNPRLPTDLATVIVKATRKAPQERYASAQELADDLDRFIHGEAIRARPPTLGYLLKLFVRQHLLAVGAAAAFVILVTAASIALSILYYRAERTVRKLYFGQIGAAHGAYQSGEIGHFRELLDAAPGELRGWEWHHLDHLRREIEESGRVVARHESAIEKVAFSPDGKRVASASVEGVIKLSGAPVPESPLVEESATISAYGPRAYGETSVDFSHDGLRLVTGNISDPEVKVWDAASGKWLWNLSGEAGGYFSIAYSRGPPDRIAGGGIDGGEIEIWEDVTRRRLHTIRAHAFKVYGLSFSPDGTRLASSSWDGIKIWAVESGKLAKHLTTDGMTGLAYSLDGRRLVASLYAIRVFDAESFTEVLRLPGHDSRIDTVAFSPDGTRILSCGFDSVIKVWDAERGAELLTLRGHDGFVGAVFSPDGDRIASGSRDGTVRLWDLHRRPEPRVVPTQKVRTFAVSSDGRWMAGTHHGSDRVTVWDIATWESHTRLEKAAGPAVGFSPGGPILATRGDSTTLVRLWATTSWEEIAAMDAGFDVEAVAFSPDGKTLAASGARRESAAMTPMITNVKAGGGSVRFWTQGDDGRWLAGPSTRRDEFMIDSLAFSPDGRELAAAASGWGQGTRGAVLLVDVASGEVRRTFPALEGHSKAAEFSPDGERLIIGEVDWVRVFSTRTLTEVSPRIRVPYAYDLAFSPDGSRVAVGCGDSTLRILDPKSGDVALILRHHRAGFTSVAFTADDRLITATDDGILVWHTPVNAGR